MNTSLQPLFDALTAQTHARSARIWLTKNSSATELLRSLATGAAPLTHQTFLDHPAPDRVRFLRQLSTEIGLLPGYNRDIDAYETWLAKKLPQASTREHQHLIKQYATWVHLNRMRHLAARAQLRPGTILAARQATSVALQFLTFLHQRGHSPSACEQHDVDDWLATGPTTRSGARTFVRWAIQNRHIPAVDFPRRLSATSPIIGQPERLNLLRRVIDGDASLSQMECAAMVLLLLYAQPFARIVEMRTEQIVKTPDGQVTLAITDNPLPVPAPFDRILLKYLGARPNMKTSANRDSKWLFPGGSPGRHITASFLMTQLREAGVDLLGAKNAALRTLVLEMPAPIVADAFGYSYQVIDIHATYAGKKWAEYAAFGTVRPGHPDPTASLNQ